MIFGRKGLFLAVSNDKPEKRKGWIYESKTDGNDCDVDRDVCGSQPVLD